MALEHSYVTYGIITDGGSPVNNANVYVVDTTTPGTTGNTTSNSDGKYILNIQTVADSSGDTIKVYVCHSGKTKQNTFTLNISGVAEQVNLALESTSITETLGTLDITPDTVKNAIQSIVEQIAMVGTTTTQASFIRSITDLTGLLGTHSISASTSVSDKIALLEIIIKNIVITREEQAAMKDQTPDRKIGHSATDKIELLASYIKALSTYYTEQLYLVDDAIPAGAIEKTVTETLALIEMITTNPSYTVTEQLALIESHIYGMKKVITEQIALNDGGYIGLYGTASDKIELKETITYFPSIVVTDIIELLTSYTTGNVVSIVESLGFLETTVKKASILVAEKLELVDDAFAGNRATIIEQIALLEGVTFSTAIFVSGLMEMIESSEKNPGVNIADIIELSETIIKGTEKIITDIIGLVDDAQTDTGIGAYPTDTIGMVDEVTQIDYLIVIFEKMGLLSSHLKDISLTIEDKIEIIQAYNTLAHIVGDYIQSYYAREHKDSDHIEEHKDSDESEVMK